MQALTAGCSSSRRAAQKACPHTLGAHDCCSRRRPRTSRNTSALSNCTLSEQAEPTALATADKAAGSLMLCCSCRRRGGLLSAITPHIACSRWRPTQTAASTPHIADAAQLATTGCKQRYAADCLGAASLGILECPELPASCPQTCSSCLHSPSFGHPVTGSRPCPAAMQGQIALADARAACSSIWAQPQVHLLVSRTWCRWLGPMSHTCRLSAVKVNETEEAT